MTTRKEKRTTTQPHKAPHKAPRTFPRAAHHEWENLIPGRAAWSVVGAESESLGMRHALPLDGGGRYDLRHLNAMFCGQPFGTASQIDQRHRDAVARICQTPIRNAADSRLIHASRLSQLSLAETLSFE